jgi:hypothetical protein
MAAVLRGFLVTLLLALACRAGADPHFAALDELTPEDQYRQLSLMLLVSAGVDEPMLEVLAPVALQRPETVPFQPDDYTTPLARIVDQTSLLAGAEQLFRFVRDNESAIRTRLLVLESDSDALAVIDQQKLDEDAILIRQAIADSMVYAGLGEAGLDVSERYRQQTVVLRNALEFVEFKQALDRITDQAIASVGGKLDAYQRMFDDETNTGTFDRRIRSAELIYLPEGQFDPKAGELTEEMLRNMVLMESQPNR